MRSYAVALDENHLVIDEYKNDVVIEYYDKDAMKLLNRLLKKDFVNNKKFATKKDVTTLHDKKSGITMEISDIEDVMRYIAKYEKREERKKEIKKRVAIGVAATVVVSTLTIGILNKMESNAEKKEKETLPIDIHEIPIVVSTDKEVTEEALEKELEETINNTLAISDTQKVETGNVVYVEAYANYDEALETNVLRYEDTINEVCEKWGVDPNLMKDIIKQESSGGEHINKTQVVFDQWDEEIFSCYNFKTNRYESFILTAYPENYPDVDHVITRESFKVPYTNISVGTAALAFVYNHSDYNLSRTVQAYNFGMTATEQVYEAASKDLGIPLNEMLKDETNMDFMHYTDIKPDWYGDHQYANKIFSFSTPSFNLDDGKSYTMKYVDDFGNICEKTTTFKSKYNVYTNNM